jgi:hypothetical protein
MQVKKPLTALTFIINSFIVHDPKESLTKLTRLGDFSWIGLLLNANYDVLKR